MSSATSGGAVREHMDVVCAGGTHLGTVDSVGEDEIRLTKSDSTDGKHHVVPTSLVGSVDDRVHLTRSADEIRAIWAMEE